MKIAFLTNQPSYYQMHFAQAMAAKIGEQNFAQGMQMVHYDLGTYFSRPICALLIAAGTLTLLAGIYRAFKSEANA